jgi:hypothetical protein
MGSLLLGLVGTQMKDRRGQEARLGNQLMVVGVCGLFGLGIPVLIAMLGGDRVWKPSLDRRLRSRPDSLLGLDEDRRLGSRVLRVEDARTYHKRKLTGEDIGIALLDPEHRRILFEGLSHRYVIRGEDVTCFWPLQAHEVISIRIDYRIGEERLALVLATTNPWFHFFHGMFAARAVQRLVSGLAESLQVEPRDADPNAPADVES